MMPRNTILKNIPAGLRWLFAAAVFNLNPTVGVGVPFFAGNLPNAADRSDSCHYRIYRDSQAYRTHQGECVGQAGTLKRRGLFSASHLQISTPQQAVKVPLTSLWGFRQGEQAYRFLDGRLYRILDYGPVVLYQGIGKFHTRYYFSPRLDDDIHWFSKKNLRRIFRANQRFLLLLDDTFSTRQLLQYDPCTGQFLIQQLLATGHR